MLETLTTLVIGASQDIGRRIATSPVEEGPNRVLVARSDGIYETENLIDIKDKTPPLKADVTREGSVKNSIGTAVERFGGLDIVVNNAGIPGPTAPVKEVKAEDWKNHGSKRQKAFFVIKLAAPYLKESNRASIINISSISGKMPLEKRTPYTTSKMAVMGLTGTLVFELGKYDGTINAI